MDIKEDEIKEIKNLGTLNGSKVKLITLKGGFHIGVGVKDKKNKKSEILAVGSHPAIVSHQICSKFNSKFEQTMAKNESDAMPSIEQYCHNLKSSDINVLGLDIYALKKNEKVEFKLTKHNFEIFNIKATELNDEIVLESTDRNETQMSKLNKKELSKSVEKTIREYAKKNGLKIKRKF
jgi:hypothetical protein